VYIVKCSCGGVTVTIGVFLVENRLQAIKWDGSQSQCIKDGMETQGFHFEKNIPSVALQ